MNPPPTLENGQSTLALVSDPSRLTAAWADVFSNDLDDGTLSAGVSRFAEDAEENLAQIAADLQAGAYMPSPLTPVGIPRPDGRLGRCIFRRSGTASSSDRFSLRLPR